MTRNDCMWVAIRCTGLVLLVIAILLLPPLVSAWSMYRSAYDVTMTAQIPGMGEIRHTFAEAGRTALVQAALQFLLSAAAAVYFLAGAPGLSKFIGSANA